MSKNKSKLDRQRRNQQREDDEDDGEVLRRNTHSSKESSTFNNVAAGAAIGAAIGLGGYLLSKVFSSSSNKPANPRYVTTSEDCKTVLLKLKEDLIDLPVLGLDCQWTETFDGERNSITLLQLATFKGKFILIAMQKLNQIPEELKEILRNREIIKTGTNVINYSKHLRHDYGLEVNSTYDVRFLVQDTGNLPHGLEKLSKNILDLDLGYDWEPMRKSDWNQEDLDTKQLSFAEQTVKASVDIFKTLIAFANVGSSHRDILKYCEPNFDVEYVKRSDQ